MTQAAATSSSPSPRTGLRIVLLIIAGIETWSAVSDVSGIFHDHGHTTPLLIFAQAATSVKLALSPFVACAALVFAALGRVRLAIAALAALILLVWLADLPSIAIHGLELSADFGGVETAVRRFVFPALAIAALVFARHNTRLWLAGALVSVPTIVNWALVVAFTASVLIYGF